MFGQHSLTWCGLWLYSIPEPGMAKLVDACEEPEASAYRKAPMAEALAELAPRTRLVCDNL